MSRAILEVPRGDEATMRRTVVEVSRLRNIWTGAASFQREMKSACSAEGAMPLEATEFSQEGNDL